MSVQPFYREPERSLLSEGLAQALNQRLIATYGSTMSMNDIAAELGISTGALRIRQSRIGDLPAPIPHLRTHRWPTPRVATWLCALGDEQAQGDFDRTPRPISRRGRRRLFASPRSQLAGPSLVKGGEA